MQEENVVENKVEAPNSDINNESPAATSETVEKRSRGRRKSYSRNRSKSVNSTVKFGELDIAKHIFDAISAMGFEEPSPIQQEVIPLVLAGDDVIGQAQTGTGKTAAFGIPLIQNITDLHSIQALVMTPTRELAIQVAAELNNIGSTSKIKTLPVYGGQPIERQIKALQGKPNIIVGTPGRLLDHISRGTIKLDKLAYLVLDEADEMLDMGFIDDVEEVLKALPSAHQTMLFSATMPRPILSLSKKYMKSPKLVAVHKEEITAPLIDQYYYEVKDKIDAMCRLLDVELNGKMIIFCRTKKGVDDLLNALTFRGYLAEGLHGDLSQSQRDRVMKKFRSGTAEVLIATDVAARGLDIDNVNYVVNFDIPSDAESYVHRIGRTGRAGNSGIALTFINPREFRQLKLIEKLVKSKIVRRQLPDDESVFERQRAQTVNKLRTVLERDKYEHYMQIVDTLLKDYDYDEIAAAAIQYIMEGTKALEDPEDEILSEDLSNTGGKPGMVRFFINIGRAQRVTVRDIINAIAIECDVPANSVGLINLFDKFSFVEVQEAVAEKVLAVMRRNKIKGYRINIEPAKPNR